MRTSQNTLWIAGAGVLAVLLVVATYFLVISPKRGEAADLAQQKVSVDAQNAQIAQETALLKSQFETLDAKKAELAGIRSTLPAQADVPQLLRQLETYADAAGVTVTQIAPGTPTAFVAGETSTADATTGIVQVSLSLGLSGTFAQTELFVKNLQADLHRYFLIENVSLTNGTAGEVVSTLTGRIFVLQDEAAVATPTPSESGTGATADVTTSTGSSSSTATPSATPTTSADSATAQTQTLVS